MVEDSQESGSSRSQTQLVVVFTSEEEPLVFHTRCSRREEPHYL